MGLKGPEWHSHEVMFIMIKRPSALPRMHLGQTENSIFLNIFKRRKKGTSPSSHLETDMHAPSGRARHMQIGPAGFLNLPQVNSYTKTCLSRILLIPTSEEWIQECICSHGLANEFANDTFSMIKTPVEPMKFRDSKQFITRKFVMFTHRRNNKKKPCVRFLRRSLRMSPATAHTVPARMEVKLGPMLRLRQ